LLVDLFESLILFNHNSEGSKRFQNSVTLFLHFNMKIDMNCL